MIDYPKYEQAADWLVDLFGRTAVEPHDTFLRLLQNEPAAMFTGLRSRSPTYLADMVAMGVLDKMLVEKAADELAGERDPADQAVALSNAAEEADELKRRELSAPIRWLESRGCDPAKIVEALVESGAVSMRQVRAAAGE